MLFFYKPMVCKLAQRLMRSVYFKIRSMHYSEMKIWGHCSFLVKALIVISLYVSIIYVIYFAYEFFVSPFNSHKSRVRALQKATGKLSDQMPRVRELACTVFQAPPEQWNDTLQKLSEQIPRDEVFDYSNCKMLKSQSFEIPTSEMEDSYPIAFSILVYADLHRFTRLLRAIYRSSNVYCVHVDQRSSQEVKSGVSNLTSCFPNVFLAPDAIEVYWGSWQVMEAEMMCLRALWKHTVKWLAFINLTGEEFPLKTNLELVYILRIMKGVNDVWLDPCTYEGPGDWQDPDCEGFSKIGFRERWNNLTKPPHGIKPYKGQVHAVLFRPTVDFILNDPRAQDIYRWVNKTFIPDELFFSTINNSPHLEVPGSNPNPRIKKPSIARLKLWKYRHHKMWPYPCEYLRGICKLTARELPLLTTSRQLFANKFKSDYRPMGYSCLEQWYFERVLWELMTSEVPLPLSQYHHIYHSHHTLNRNFQAKKSA